MVRVNRNNIVIVSSQLNVAGGLEKMVVSLANLLSDHEYTITLIIIGRTQESFYPINNTISIKWIDLTFGIAGTSNYLNRKVIFIRDILKLKKIIDPIHPDFIITTEYAQTVAIVLGRIYKKYKIIAWQHSAFTQEKSYLWRQLSFIAYNRVQSIVCLTRDDEKIYKRYNSNTVVIPNFIVTSNKEVASLESNIILTVARLTPSKGIDLLMEAAKIIFSKYKNWKWKVIGTGVLKEKLLHFITKHQLTGNLIYQAPVNDQLDKEYRSAAIYALTSRTEPFGMVLLEAMSHGTPCVAFDCDNGPRNIITQNVDGLLVEKERPEKLAEGISILIEDVEKRSHLGKAAFENVKRFSSDVILKKWEDLFHYLLPY